MTRERVAVIGGGIFGSTCALVLRSDCDVTLFERNAEVLLEASRANQYRHHMGYHYPRSPETIREIQAASADFEAFYGEAIVRDAPSYYCVAKQGSRTSPEAFLKLCDELGLPYEEKFPPAELLDRSSVALCVKTPEAVYNYELLQQMIRQRLTANSKIILKLGYRVVGAARLPSGEKRLTIVGPDGVREEVFDAVINATYANYNQFSQWMRFTPRLLRFDLKELIIVKLPVAQRVAITVMDGPFATLVPIGGSSLFTLGDVLLAVHDSVVLNGSESSFDERWKRIRTRWDQMQVRCSQWMPILRRAAYVESMFVTLPVDPDSGETDARPTEVTAHGEGCWSILSGKIITAVSAAKQIRREMALALQR